jgi:hypothetical protein
MFLNARLLVVAVLAAIAGITCGLGLFATFRVNHEPLARLSEGGPPLQLAFDNLAPMPDMAAPMAARYPLNGGAKPLSAPVLIPPPGPALDPGEGAANAVDSAGTAAPTDQKDETSVAVATLGGQSAGAAENIEMAQHATDIAASGEREPGKTPPPTAAGSGAIEVSIDSGATDAAAEKTALANSAAASEEPVAKQTKARESDVVKPPAKAARPAIPIRGASKVVRIRRRPTTVAAQPANAWTQPTYQWTDTNIQAPQTVRRVVVKRHRAAKKTAPAAQPKVTGATAAALGAQ